MLEYFAVVYDPDGKKNTVWVKRNWIYPVNTEIYDGQRRYIYYHEDKEVNIMATLIKPESKSKENGFLYPGIVLKGFGKY